jgi:hypothetical protein
MAGGVDVAVMLEERKRPEAAAAPPDEFEWVNCWAAQAPAAVPAGARPNALDLLPAGGRPGLAVVAGTDVKPAVELPAHFDRDVLLAGDIIDIADARDGLLAAPRPPAAAQPMRHFVWLPVGLGRTADSVPIILGSVLGFLMVLVFATAAMFVKLAR